MNPVNCDTVIMCDKQSSQIYDRSGSEDWGVEWGRAALLVGEDSHRCDKCLLINKETVAVSDERVYLSASGSALMMDNRSSSPALIYQYRFSHDARL